MKCSFWVVTKIKVVAEVRAVIVVTIVTQVTEVMIVAVGTAVLTVNFSSLCDPKKLYCFSRF